ncbi:helix-turn-helix transcriptional regulator [Micromonospora sp. WMMD1128]|uniref:helix-turn-helix domain-containing protein n=1 Tax=Micromonospora sp. WMMD1128 TaxID=3015150 RepID=UPI00248B1A54|nr:helix-turn-helix transcriptional regulator [Micromonospora sp. WMMD1128]WBB73366.1 helix-turn-helix transcriptional regulator [Micromonospora sp. WMMD1128]
MDERLQVLIEELRHMRAARKMTQEDLAKAISYSPSTVAMVETGARRPPPDFWDRVDVALDTCGVFGRMLARLGSPQWMREWEANERQATVLRSFENTVVPGLLQTSAYARALFRSVGLFDEAEVERRVEARLARQAVLAGEKPPHLVAMLDEHVLRRPVGGPLVMREQVLRLVKVADENPRVRIQVVPASTGAYSGVAGAFVLATLPSGEDVVYLDDQLKGQVIDRTEDVLAVRSSWESIEGEALPPRQSMELLTEVAETWRT